MNTGLLPVVITLTILLIASIVVNIFFIIKLKHKTPTSPSTVEAADTHQYQAPQVS